MKTKSVKISPELRERYEKRRLELEKSGTQDPENAMLPIAEDTGFCSYRQRRAGVAEDPRRRISHSY